MLARPKRRPPLVDEDCGGGFWICDAVGARDWRIEYVRCMMGWCFVIDCVWYQSESVRLVICMYRNSRVVSMESRVSPGSGRVLVCIRRPTGEAGCDVTTSCFDHRMSRAYTGLASSHHTTMQIQRSCHCPGNWKPLSPSCRALHLETSYCIADQPTCARSSRLSA